MSVEVSPPVKPIISESQFHDAVKEEIEVKRSQDEFFGTNDVEVHV